MVSSSVVFYKIATTCLLILVGFIARRMKLLPEISVTVISKFSIYLALPCFMLFYMPACISRETVGLYWYYPLVGVLLLALTDLLAYTSARIWARPGEKATFRVLVGMPNWIFMAMAVCEPLFKEEGVRMVLLYNVGITFYFWTFGMTSFRSAVGWKEILKQLFVNIQTIAIIVGIILAMLFPSLRGFEKLDSSELAELPFYLGLLNPVWETISLVGGTALPLSILQIGMLLGEERKGEDTVDKRSLALTSLWRLLLVPMVILTAQLLMCNGWIPYTRNEFLASAIIMSMPAATLCLVVAEVYAGAVRLAAQGILWTTIASLATVPVVTWIAQVAYEWMYGT